MNLQKRKVWRSEKYLKWVRTQPCCFCEDEHKKKQAHHIKGVGNMSGGALKAPDWATMSLCDDVFGSNCHAYIQSNPEMWERQWEWIARTLGKAIDEGVLK